MLCKPQTPSVAIGRRGRRNMRSEQPFAIMSRFGFCRGVGTPGSPAAPGWTPVCVFCRKRGLWWAMDPAWNDEDRSRFDGYWYGRPCPHGVDGPSRRGWCCAQGACDESVNQMLRDDAEPCCRLHSLGARAGVGYVLRQHSIRWHAINSDLWWGRLQLLGADLRIRAREACRKCLAYLSYLRRIGLAGRSPGLTPKQTTPVVGIRGHR